MQKHLSKSTFIAGLSLSVFIPAIALAQTAPTPIFRTTFNQGTVAEVAGSRAEPLEDTAIKSDAGVLGAGISLPRGKQLIYEGAGNAYIPSGTLSFFWRSDEKLGQSENEVFTISGFQRFYFCRWLRVYTHAGKLRLGFYTNEHHNGNGLELVARDFKLDQSTWHHIAVSWDQGRGVALYVDGKLAAASEKPWFYAGNINHIGLAGRASSYSKPSPATWSQSFDEVQIYERWMEAEDIVRLSQNKQPQNALADLKPLLQERQKRLGLNSSASLPQLDLKDKQQTLLLKQVALPTARDVLSTTRSGLDGDLGRAWPGMQGYSNSGKRLQIALEPDATFDTVQSFGSGPMKFTIADKSTSGTSSASTSGSTLRRTLLQLPAGDVRMEAVSLAQKVRGDQLLVDREDGLLFNVQLFDAGTTPLPAAGKNGWEYRSLDVASPSSVEPTIEAEFATYDQLTLTVADKPAQRKEAFTLPAMQAMHLLGPAAEEQRGLSTLALDLAVKQSTPENTLSLIVVDPLNYERRTAMVNLKTAKSTSGRLRVVLDLRDLLISAEKRPWLILYSENPIQFDLTDSRIGFQWTSVDTALEELLPDQMAYARDAFQELSEGRPWSQDPEKRKWLRSMLNILNLLHELRPDDPAISGYWHWTHPREPIQLTKLPTVPENIPPWAIYTDRSLELFQKAAHWWIDNRMTPEGEFGAPDGLNDDTDLIQDWAAIDLMRGPDPKIRHAIDLVADATWHQTTIDGISRQITDTLHIYEWGINAQTMAFMLNIGDPVYYERLLRFASHYDELTAITGEKGHRHFKSWYFGASKIVTEGIYGQDRAINALLLQPAMLLAWYNGDAEARDLVADWSRAMMEHIDEQAKATSRVPGASVEFSNDQTIPERNLGIAFPEAVWAAYDLTGDKTFLDAYGRLIDYEISRKPQEGLLRTPSTLAAYLRESGDDRWDAFLKKSVSDPQLWTTSQHNNNYRTLHEFYATWQRTNDDEWLNKGSGLALHHMDWSLPMLTSAEQTTDRVWLPQSLANRTVLGDLSILRNQIYPKHSVSWENATGRIAPLVRKQSRNELEVEIHNLENRAVTVDARLWRLDHGRYEVRTVSAPHADASRKKSSASSKVLSRFDAVPIELAPSSVTTVTIQQTEALENLQQAADLGISKHDATFSKAGTLTFKVHNIGAKASGTFRVKIQQNGKTLSEQQHKALQSPANYRTDKAVFTVSVTDKSTPVVIEVIPEGELPEITKVNNRIEIAPQELPETIESVEAEEK